jgi:aerobic C4-dicarboxylate transport protein
MRRIMRPIYIQVLLGVVIGAGLGFVAPNIATQMKPLGDLFVSLVHLLIAPLVFCTVSTGVARVSSLGHAGRIGLTALLYFLIASTFALLFGVAIGLLVKPGLVSTSIRLRSA